MKPDFTPKWHRLESQLRELAVQPLGAAEIGRRLGVTRNAVISKAQALGISIRRAPEKPRQRKPRRTPPNLLPLVERALAADPTGRPSKGSCARTWPLHVAAYVANVELCFPTRAVGPLIGRDRKLVSYAVRRIEERRDEDPAFDAFLERLSEQARELAA